MLKPLRSGKKYFRNQKLQYWCEGREDEGFGGNRYTLTIHQ